MLTARSASGSTSTADAALPADTVWVDLLDPTAAERSAVQELIGAALPDRAEIGHLGLSSRHHDDQRMFSLHARMYSDEAGKQASPLGIVITRDCLVTVRYAESKTLREAFTQLRDTSGKGGPHAFVVLMETLINDVASDMQKIADDTAALSEHVFTQTRQRTPVLRDQLVRIGKLEGRLARYRTSMLGFARVTALIDQHAPSWIDEGALTCMKVVSKDIRTLGDFDEQLTGKLQFLQDAVLGFINTDQNAVMKLLTVASVVTIPPVILAGIWGMNFRHMPELDKVWGYPAALGALLVSMLLPLAWFRARGWLSKD